MPAAVKAFPFGVWGSKRVSKLADRSPGDLTDEQRLDWLQLIGGVSYDRLHYPRNVDTSPITGAEATSEQFSPKAGILWSPLDDTHVRAAYTRSLGGVFFDQSVRLEPASGDQCVPSLETAPLMTP